MNEPRIPVSVDETERITAVGDGPLINPPRAMVLKATNAGILIFGVAALIFCVRGLFQAFLVSNLIVVSLALVNLILLFMDWRERVHLRAAALAARVTAAAQKRQP